MTRRQWLMFQTQDVTRPSATHAFPVLSNGLRLEVALCGASPHRRMKHTLREAPMSVPVCFNCRKVIEAQERFDSAQPKETPRERFIRERNETSARVLDYMQKTLPMRPPGRN